jgi:LuxR family transcriptional regulator, quorum-sensing system regulator SdiA
MSPQRVISDVLAQLKALAPAGYAIALHVRFTTPSFLFQTYPRTWIDYYSKMGLVMQDPTVRWGFENTGTKRWSTMTGDDPAGVIAAAAEHGMAHGFTLAIDDSGSRSIASFARSDADFSDDDIAMISELARQLHLATANADTLLPETRDKLRNLSIMFTHP